MFGYTDEKAQHAVRRAARHIAAAMQREWDAGLWTEMRTCLAQWRFGDALLIAGELEARQRCGCSGSITTEGAQFRLTEAWLDQREAEIAALYGAHFGPAEPQDDSARSRHHRLGIAGRTN